MDLDLFDERFPHGTLAGYSKGCSGLACPLELDAEYLSCREVSKAVQGQPVVRIGRYDKVPRGGEVTRAVPAPPLPAAPAPTASAEPLRPVAYEDEVVLRQPVPADLNPKTRQPVQDHGTTARYQRGCTTEQQCPNYGTDQPTCSEARRQYQRDYKARKRATAPSSNATGRAPEPQSSAVPQPSIEESAAATDLTPSSIEHEPAPEETSVPDPAPIAAAVVDVVEAGYPDDVDHPSTPADTKSAREIELEGQLQRVNGEKIRLEQDLERAHAEIARLERAHAEIARLERAHAEIARLERIHRADDALIQQSRARDAELVVAGTGVESPPALAESIELTVRGVHLSLPADSGLEVRALGDAVFVRAGR